MEIIIRKALREDCEAIMKLVNELAVYEKAPEEVTVSMEHFLESGFGERPVWEAFVAVQPPLTPPEEREQKPPLTPPEERNYRRENISKDVSQEKIQSQSPLPSSHFLPPSEELEGAASTPLQSSSFPSPPGRIGGAVIAFALYYTRYSTWKGQRMYLEDLLVTEEMRGKGIGKLLFEKLIEECKIKKYSGLVWQVLDWNEPAINFYKKFDGVKFDGEWVNCSLEIK